MASGASTCRRRTTARRQALKPRHLGSGRKVEKFRALFAGLDLHEAAVKAAGLDNTDIAGEPVAKLAKQHAIPVVDTSYRFTMADPRRANGDFRHGGMRDTACFEGLLDRVEHGVPRMEVQANAWATGTACAEAFGGADFARQQGLTDLRQRGLPGTQRQWPRWRKTPPRSRCCRSTKCSPATAFWRGSRPTATGSKARARSAPAATSRRLRARRPAPAAAR